MALTPVIYRRRREALRWASQRSEEPATTCRRRRSNSRPSAEVIQADQACAVMTPFAISALSLACQ